MDRTYRFVDFTNKLKAMPKKAQAVAEVKKLALSQDEKKELALFRAKTDSRIKAFEKKIYEKIAPLYCEAWVTDEPLPFERREEGDFVRLEVGDCWSDKVFGCAWFRVTGKVPAVCERENLVCRVDISGEGLVTDTSGEPIRGVTTFSYEFDYAHGMPQKKEIALDERICKNGRIEFYIDGANNDMFGRKLNGGRVMKMELSRENPELSEFKFAYEILVSLFDSLPPEEAQKKLALARAAEKAANSLEKGYYAEALKTIREELKKGEKSDFYINALGHGHLDLAWLWPVRETLRKGARTFSTQLANAEQYPGYIFGASQAQLFSWMKQHYPSLYERIKEAVAEGKIDIQGAAWVESDINIPCGESLIRQMLYGKKFFKEEFGIDPKVLWIPDTFGYSASLPQILSKCGIPYFITQKLSWNTVNKFPYQSFNWSGNGPGEVLAHLLPADTYNSPVTAEELRRVESKYTERAVSDRAMMAFGIGDGGAGPDRAHLERFKILEETAYVPHIEAYKTQTFMEKLAEKRENYPSFSGELYLEKHQGTYTTQAKNKKYNRLLENNLRECEAASAAAEAAADYKYPAERLQKIWEEALLYQFHDILPGSSIKRVYDESVARYEELLDEVKELTARAYEALGRDMSGHVAWNMQSWERCENGVKIPAMGGASVSAPKTYGGEREIPGNVLENEHLRVSFGENGAITSLFSKKSGFETAARGEELNKFVLYTDVGDCWDIMPANYEKLPSTRLKAFSVRFFETENAKFARVVYKFGKSEIKQKIILENGSDILRFETSVKWNERARMLRALFPVSPQAENAKFNIQYGHIERSMGHTSSIEKARWEVSAHKWVDISDGKNGVALLNDCKYGYKVWDSVISMNLLRSPSNPGKKADIGEHSFAYALCPHSGSVGADIYKKAYFFNSPLRYSRGTGDLTEKKLFECDNPSLIFDSLKKSENGEGYILKVFNSSEETQNAEISSPLFRFAEETNLCEETLSPLSGENRIPLTLAPFEVKAFRLVK